MENVHLVLDLDGFVHRNELLVREMGFCTVDVTTRSVSRPYSYLYDLSDVAFDAKDARTAFFVSERLTGMYRQPQPAEAQVVRHWNRTLHDLKELHETRKTPDRYVVAYKGGHFEKRLLDLLGIQSKNLEDWGCPKYDLIAEPCDREMNCGFHFQTRHIRETHCPRSEVHAFRRWLYRLADKCESALGTNSESKERN